MTTQDVEASASLTATDAAIAELTGPGMWAAVRRQAGPTAKYLMSTEVHTYAFSVACNAILSFVPFMVLLLTITRRVFHSQMMYDVILGDNGLMRSYLPSNQEFIIKNLRALSAGHRMQLFSAFMLFVSSTGVFLPLEVALNKVWGFDKNRSYLGNQAVSLGLALGCGTLALMSIGATAVNWRILGQFLGTNILTQAVGYAVMKLFAILAAIATFFLIYWLLPNGKVSARAVLPSAIITGVSFELVKLIYVIALPWLNFEEVYGPFSISVTLMFWAFVSGLLLLGGAYLSAAEHERTEEPKIG